jgi:hypothetical protein
VTWHAKVCLEEEEGKRGRTHDEETAIPHQSAHVALIANGDIPNNISKS